MDIETYIDRYALRQWHTAALVDHAERALRSLRVQNIELEADLHGVIARAAKERRRERGD